ncbi:MAG: hypothetical protein AAF661_03920 [Pseudomonadota bacterium]
MNGCLVDPVTGSLRLAAKLAEQPFGAATATSVTQDQTASDAAFWFLRQRNAFLDWMFYDVASLSALERDKVAMLAQSAGAMLVVSPSGGRSPQFYPTIEDLAVSIHRDVRVAALAGVGSTALGAAALARNVADAVGEPVVTVISDYTVVDAMNEVMGGWFMFEAARRLTDPGRISEHTFVQSGRDVDTLASLLSDDRFDLRLLVGHSKGGTTLSNALYRQVRAKRRGEGPGPDKSRLIITLGGAIVMPKGHTVIDVIGDFDALGWLNSDPRATIERRAPLAGHHTNTMAPNHLNVRSTIETVLGDLAENDAWLLANKPNRRRLPEIAVVAD